MKKIINILILIFVFMFSFELKVNAESYMCNYQLTSNSDEKISITIDFDGVTMHSTIVNGLQFFPVQSLHFFDTETIMVNRTGNLFYHDINMNQVYACPKTIQICKNETIDVLDDDRGDNTPISQKIVVFDKKGISKDNVEVELNRADGDETTAKIKNMCSSGYKTYQISSSSKTEDKKETDSDGYIECLYNKRNDNNEYKFKFKSFEGIGYFYQNNNWVEISLNGLANEFNIGSTCPQAIDFSNNKFSKKNVDDCDDESSCYFRKGDSQYYLNQKSYKYFLYGGSRSNYIVIDVNTGENETDIKVKYDENFITIENINEYKEKIINEDLPKFIIKVKDTSQYIFINSIKNEEGKIIEADELYIESGAFGPSGTGLSDEMIIKTCKELFGKDFLELLNDYVFKVIWIGVPIILILLTTFDFAKVVFSDDKDGMANAFTRLWKRAIAAVLIFLTPYIIIWIANLVDPTQTTIQSCAKKIRQMGNTSYIVK